MNSENNQCFVIMPIGDQDKKHTKDHFRKIYDDLLIPAIKSAGFVPKRAGDDLSSSMIQIEIVRDLVSSPMAICDLSTRNPNVLFELGIRQAFDLPVVLVQEKGTKRIFDISTINTIEYRPGRIYDEVLEDRELIKVAIESTRNNNTGINSIIRLLDNVSPATVDKNKHISKADEILFKLSQIEKTVHSIYYDYSSDLYIDYLNEMIYILDKNLEMGELSTKELVGQVYLIEKMISYSKIDTADMETLEMALKGTVYKYYEQPLRDFFGKE